MGSIVTVAEADFLVQQEKDYGITNMTYRQIYNFFSKHSQNFFYSVHLESPLSEVVNLDSLREFGLFGISFNEDMVKIKNKQFLLILHETDVDSLAAIQNAVEREMESTGCQSFRYAVIEKEYGSDSTGELQRQCDNELLRTVMPHIKVFNDGFPEIVRRVESVLRLAGKFAYRNFAEFFAGRTVNSSSLPLNLQNLNAILDDILAVKDERVIYTCDSIGASGIDITDPVYRLLLSSMAAYLAVEYRLKFELSGILNDIYLNASASLTSQFYNYVDEYLKLVSNPVDCGFTVQEEMAYLYMLDRNEMHVNPGKFCPVVRYVGIEFDLDACSFADSRVVSAELALNRIEVLCMEDVFGISSASVVEARTGMIKLGKLIGDFVTTLKAAHYPVSKILDVTNMMLCKSGGKVYLAYVTSITGCYPYNVQPVNTRFRPFKEYVAVNRLQDIKDLSLLEDGAVFEKILRSNNLVAGTNSHYRLPRTARGIMYKHLVAVEGYVDEDIVRADELGLWYFTSAQFRGNAKAGVLPLLSLDVARNYNFITCFGGPHPCIRTNFDFDYKCWR